MKKVLIYLKAEFKEFFNFKEPKMMTVKIFTIFIVVLLSILTIVLVSVPGIEDNKVLQFIAISHWETAIIIWFILFSAIILFYYQHKGDEHLMSKSFKLVLLGGIIFGLMTGFLRPSEEEIALGHSWLQESTMWLYLVSIVFMFLMLFIVPFLIFFTIIRTLISSRENKIKPSTMIKAFFSIWFLPFIAITVAILLYPLIRMIPPFPNPTPQPFDGTITTVPGIIYSAIPITIGIFFGSGKILAVVILSIFVGTTFSILIKTKPERSEELVNLVVIPQKIISKMIYHVSLLVPLLIATRIPVLFDVKTMVETFKGISIFFAVFLIGWFIVLTIEILITAVLMRNRDWKHFFKFIKRYFGITFIKHAAAVHMEDTIRESEELGVSKDVAELTSSMSTSMGQSTCGGFYPAMIALTTLSMMIQTDAPGLPEVFTVGWIVSFIITIYVVIMTTNLGMTGVPGADTGVILSVLAGVGLPSTYFSVVFSVDAIINHIRGIGNAFGFIAANNIAERVIHSKRSNEKAKEKIFDEKKDIKQAFDFASDLIEKEKFQQQQKNVVHHKNHEEFHQKELEKNNFKEWKNKKKK